MAERRGAISTPIFGDIDIDIDIDIDLDTRNLPSHFVSINHLRDLLEVFCLLLLLLLLLFYFVLGVCLLLLFFFGFLGGVVCLCGFLDGHCYFYIYTEICSAWQHMATYVHRT